MSTRCLIAARLTYGSYGCIYVSHDGYPAFTGATLIAHYKKQEEIAALIALGDCSYIDSSIAACVSYAWCGEDFETVKPSSARTAFAAAEAKGDCGAEYLYVWDGEKWSAYMYDWGKAPLEIDFK